MKHLYRILFLLFTIALSEHPAAQWVRTAGPEGGTIGVIFNDVTSGAIFAGGAGLYRSLDNGATWSEANAGMDGAATPRGVYCYLLKAGSSVAARKAVLLR